MPDSPDFPSPATLCARCGSRIGEEAQEDTCHQCLAQDMAGGEWSDLLEPGNPELLAGGGFLVLEEIGRGGMGIVYRARQRAPEREVALKLLPPALLAPGDGAQRLLAEAAMLAEMDHPGILPLYASGEQDGRPWLAMKLATGGTLAARQGEWQSRWRECAELTAGLADAVQHAHERGLIHRDLKPANILFDDAGRAYVADFGLAKWRDRDSGLTHTNTVLGTPAYMAPEVARADGRAATTAADVYGLGGILYYLLCGRAPYEQAGTLEMLRRIADHDPAPPRQSMPGIPGDLQVICLKAMARQPQSRYGGAAALAADLRRWLAGDAVEARPESRAEKVQRWVRRHPLSAGLAAVLAVTAAGGGTALWLKNQDLATALHDVRLSLDTAYSSLGYATREIPAQLEPVGRLELLEGLFQNVEGKLIQLQQSVSTPDAAGMVYQAELYAHWSRVRRWRGDYAGGREKITRAIQLADQAVQNARAAAHARVVQSMAHRLLTEQLTEDEDFATGAAELEKARAAVAAGLRRHPGDFSLRVEQAEVAHRECDSRWKEGNGPALALAARTSAELWAALESEMHEPGANSSASRQWRERSAMPLYYLAHAAKWTGERAEEEKYARARHRVCEDRLAQFPHSTELKHDVVAAGNLLMKTLFDLHDENPPEPVRQEILVFLKRADELGNDLCELTDKANERWRSEWATVALNHGVLLCTPEGTAEGRNWLNKCVERLAPVKTSSRAYVREVQVLVRRSLAQAAEREDKLPLWLEAEAEITRVAATPPYRWRTFFELIDAQRLIAEHLLSGGTVESTAQQWLSEARAAAAQPGASPHWAAVEASIQRRIADAIMTNPARIVEARAANRAAFTLRASVMRSVSLHARRAMTEGLAGAAGKLFTLAPIQLDDARMVLREMTDLAPVALADNSGRQWRAGWETAAQSALSALPEPEQEVAAAAFTAALFPEGSPRIAAVSPEERRQR